MDPYRVLGVSTGATKDEIKAAFRKLALVHHPDLHVNASAAVKANAESTFRALNEAYSALTDGTMLR
jgi:curved DNA-binding protein CbpA